MDYFRYFPEDVTIEGCVESEGGKEGKRGRRKQGEEVDWYRYVFFLFFLFRLSTDFLRRASSQRLLLPLLPPIRSAGL
jgi:hypothetical protein